MSFEILFMLCLIAAALVCFALDLFPIEVTALGMLATLLATGILGVDDAIAGLSNKAVVTVGAMLVLSHALVRTGLLEVAADRLAGRAGRRPWMAVTLLLGAAAVLSGFLNNTAVVAILVPLATDLCRRLHLSPSKVLLPLSYAAIFGGTLTLIGTSTNLLVSAIAEDHGLEPFAMFELTPLGLVLLVGGLLYLVLVAPLALPTRALPQALTRQYGMAPYLTELRIQEECSLVGATIEESEINRDYDITVLEIQRQGRTIRENLRRLPLQVDDHLIVRGSVEDLLRLRRDKKVALLSDVKLTDAEFSEEGQVMCEALVPPRSRLIGRTLAEAEFRQRLGAFVLAIRRRGEILREKIARIPLQFADDLLLVVPQERLDQLRNSEEVIILSELQREPRRQKRSLAVVVILPAVVLLAALGITDILKAALLGTAALFLVGGLRPTDAYRNIDWSVLFLIAAFVPVGTAMERTGTADFLVSGLLGLREALPFLATPSAMVALLYLTTTLMTQTISNNATAILVAPIAIRLAAEIGVDPRPLLIAVTFAASAEFMTPYGYQTNMMVYGPGGYRFLDYTRFGAPLNVAFWLVASALIPWFWSF